MKKVEKNNISAAAKAPGRRLIGQYSQLSFFQIFGAIILLIGVITLLLIGIYELGLQYHLDYVNASKDKPDTSALVAIGFLMIMLGMAFLFPSMLQSSDNNTSSMRVVVFMITCLFVFLCAKIGWKAGSFAEFKLDSTWAYLMAAAMGSKALQSFSENRPGIPFTGTNTGPNAGIPPSMNNPAPQGPPPFIAKQLPK